MITRCTMLTYSGQAIDPMDPHPNEIHLIDIAHALSNVCRYGGHSSRHYSVAEHSYHVSQHVAPEHALWGLLHDATEAYIGDMVHPLKTRIPAFREIEDRLASVIFGRFGLFGPMPQEVKDADLRIVWDEKALLMSRSEPWPFLEGTEPLGADIMAFSPREAKTLFLHRFRELTIQ